MSEYLINTDSQNNQQIMDEIHALGIIEEIYKDGSFNFRTYDAECEEELGEVLEEHEIDSKLV